MVTDNLYLETLLLHATPHKTASLVSQMSPEIQMCW